MDMASKKKILYDFILLLYFQGTNVKYYFILFACVRSRSEYIVTFLVADVHLYCAW